jgi:Spy/CpxP family protein refolding chaperone
MKTKQIAILMALIFPMAVAAYPGGKGDGEGRQEKRMERLSKELSLTEEQKTKVGVVFKEQGEKYKAIHDETRTQLKTILTPEQFTKLEEMKQRRHDKWREKAQTRRLEKPEATK